jgi:hypothetical protein
LRSLITTGKGQPIQKEKGMEKRLQDPDQNEFCSRRQQMVVQPRVTKALWMSHNP